MTRITVLIIVVCLLSTILLASNSTIPRVAVVVEITDPIVLGNIDTARLKAVELAVAQHLIVTLHDVAPYIDWQPDVPSTTNVSVEPAIILRVSQHTDTSVHINFEATNHRSRDRLREVPSWMLYEVNSLRRITNDRAKLQKDIIASIDDNLTETLQRTLWKSAVQTIPIATGVEAEIEETGVYFIIPVEWEQLRPATSSIFYVRADVPSRSHPNRLMPLRLYLEPAERYAKGRKWVLASPVHECHDHVLTFQPLPHEPPRSPCSMTATRPYSELRSYLTPAVLRHASVFIINYERDRF